MSSNKNNDVLAVMFAASEEATPEMESKIMRARVAVAELIRQSNRAIEMLKIAGPLVGEHAAYEVVHYDGADCDGTCIQEDCRDAAECLTDALARVGGAA
jgi:hypothetical protein